MQTITRIGTFDSAHRVLNEKMKCFNIHGHTYRYEITFAFDDMQDIGYAIDFKEIKRIGGQWIDDNLDHGTILNHQDFELFKACKFTKSKMWIMTLNGAHEYCNPTVENIAREIFLAMHILFRHVKGLLIHEVKLWETPNCYTTCTRESIPTKQWATFEQWRFDEINKYRLDKGQLEYDDRKTKPSDGDVAGQ